MQASWGLGWIRVVFFVSILVLFSLEGICNAKKPVDILRVGMTEQEVISAFGPPDSAYNKEMIREVWTGRYTEFGWRETYNERYWIRIYEYIEGVEIGSWRVTGDTVLTCYFNNGKLYSWTRRPFKGK